MFVKDAGSSFTSIISGFEISFRFVIFLPLHIHHNTCMSSSLIWEIFSSRSATTGFFDYTKTRTRLQREIWNITTKNKDPCLFHGKTLKVLCYFQSEKIWVAFLQNSYMFAKNYNLHWIAGKANILSKYIIYKFFNFGRGLLQFLSYVISRSSSFLL